MTDRVGGDKNGGQGADRRGGLPWVLTGCKPTL